MPAGSEVGLGTTATPRTVKVSREVEIKMRPSEFVQQRLNPQSMTTSQPTPSRTKKPIRIIEFLNPGESTSNTRDLSVNIDEPLFQPFPSEITFPVFEPFQRYQVNLSLRNNDKVARRVKILPPDSPFFSVSGPIGGGKTTGKVAPGMDVTYTIQFRPEDRIDYKYDLICMTEREKFIIPIHAIGGRGALDFPDMVDFGSVPVKYPTTKTILVRNVGDSSSVVNIVTAMPFKVSPNEVSTNVGEAVQVNVTFEPEFAGEYTGEIILQYQTGEKAYVHTSGIADDVNIRLEKSTIRMEPTYITLSSKKTLKIYNRSDIKVQFEWKQYATVEEEKKQREIISSQIGEVATRNEALLQQGEIENEGDPAMGLQSQLIESTRNIKNLLKDLNRDRMFFSNDAFLIEPLSGEIWPNSQMEVTVTFLPQVPSHYTCSAYCDISGRESRLPLALRGQGLGPNLAFSYDVLDVGDVFINSSHEYELLIENRGEIESSFQLHIPGGPFGSKFEFSPEAGVLAPGEQRGINVRFCSDVLGMFSEYFKFKIEGSSDDLTVNIKGSVIGPTFHFDVHEINFGIISYGFLQSKCIVIENTSDIPMNFSVRIPTDGNFLQREFDIVPSTGTIMALGRQKIQVDFIPANAKKYDTSLVVDVECVGEAVLSLPIRADCYIPKVSMATEALEYGECFIRYTYTKAIELSNDSEIPARYEIIPQPETSYNVALITADKPQGVIPAGSDVIINVSLAIEQVGNISIPIECRVLGHGENGMQATISATGIGPRVSVEPALLDFGNHLVLQEKVMEITLHNKSVISAPFECYIQGKKSVFSVEARNGMIPASSSLPLKIKAYMDDNLVFRDVLVIAIKDGDTFEVNLRATGAGTTIVCEELGPVVDFGNQFTNRTTTKTLIFENKGRRPQTIKWIQERRKTPANEKPLVPVFSVEPDRFILEPKTSCFFTIKGVCSNPRVVEEKLVCTAALGNAPKPIYECKVIGSFIHPLAKVSEKSLSFQYVHDVNVTPVPQARSLTLTNVSGLPLDATFRCNEPFKSSHSDLSFQPGQEHTISVTYDLAGDLIKKQSAFVNGKFTISYRDHPHKDDVDLKAEVSFPNVSFDVKEINFGCIVNDTEKHVFITVTNTSKLPADGRWIFVQEFDDGHPQDPPLNCVFDVLPVRFSLQPGESEKMEFIFYGHADRKFHATAACEISGGPTYDIALMGEASTMNYKLDRTVLDYGMQLYGISSEKEFFITNNNKVAFEFNVDLSNIGPNCIVEAIPSSGRINGQEKQKVTIRMTPKVPDVLREKIMIQVAHFEPQEISLNIIGVFPRITLNLPRIQDEDFTQLLSDARASLMGSAEYWRSLQAYQTRIAASPPQGKRVRTADSVTTTRYSVSTPTGTWPSLSEVFAEAERIVVCQSVRKPKTSIQPDLNSSEIARLASTQDAQGLPICARYTCDFGNVIKGTVKRKVLKVTNSGPTVVVFDIIKKSIGNSGFQIEPDRVIRLPEKESVDFNIVFQTKGLSIGSHEIVLPIVTRSGPRFHVTLKAKVSQPDINISTDRLEYGNVFSGRCKIMYIQLHNTSEVPTEWSYDRNRERSRDMHNFAVEPSSGILQPDDRVNVAIRFSPTEERIYNVRIPIRIEQNPKILYVACKGNGVDFRLRFEPKAISYPISLPQLKYHQELVVHNDSDAAIEFYSVDFDSKYIQDEDILKAVCGTLEEPLLAKIREPGAGLQDDILERYNKEIISTKAAASATANEQVPTLTLNDPDAQKEVGDLVANTRPDITPPKFSKLHIFLHGPPSSGKTTQAALLAQRYGLAIINIEDVILETVESGSDLGLKAREILDPNRLGADNSRPSASDLADEGTAAKADDEVAKLQASAVKPEIRKLPKSLVVAIIAERMKLDDCSQGVVVDGFDCKYLQSVVDTVHVLLSACGSRNSRFIIFDLDVVSCRSRNNQKQNQLAAKAGLTKTPSQMVLDFKELSEEEYDSMTLDQRKAYDAAWSIIKRQRKAEIERRRQEEEMRRRQEEEILKSTAAAQAKQQDKKKEKPKAGKDPVKDQKPISEKDAKDTKDPKKKDEGAKQAGDLDSRTAEDGSIDEIGVGVSKFTETISEAEQILSDYLGQYVDQTKQSVPVTRLSASSAIEMVFADVCVTLPEPEKAKEMNQKAIISIPDEAEYQIIHKPRKRTRAGPVVNFRTMSAKVMDETDTSSSLDPKLDSAPLHSSRSDGAKKKEREAAEAKAKEEQAALNSQPQVIPQSRWILAPRSSTKVLVEFSADEPGKYDRNLSFEIVGFQKEFVIPATVSVAYPQISQDYRNVFYRKSKTSGAARQFIISKNTFDYGALLVRKDRDGYMEKPHAEHYEKLRITNNGLFNATVNFCFAKDRNQQCYILHPGTMQLKKDETQELTVWAYPKDEGTFDDEIVCLVKDNPEPVMFNITCVGSKPKVKVQLNALTFDRLLVQRKESKTITITNNAAIPVRWKVPDVANLGEDFGLSASEGIIEAAQTYNLVVEFRAQAPGALKKSFKIEVTDIHSVGGIVQTEVVQLQAEAYDISLDVQYPKGYETGFDLGTCRVGDEMKHTITMKNKGKYDLNFQFVIPPTSAAKGVVTITPMEGHLGPPDKPLPITLVFTSQEEVNLKDNTDVVCQVREGQNVVANIPIKVSIRSLFSRYRILPAQGINFGPVVMNTKKTRKFKITNTGEFEFKFRILRQGDLIRSVRTPDKEGGRGKEAAKDKEKDKKAFKVEPSVVMGAFTITPGGGIIPPGGESSISIDFMSADAVVSTEILAIDISDRDKSGDPDGIPYELAGEVCIPGINVTDMHSIFEEQAVCSRLDPHQFTKSAYAEDERVFTFGAIIAGQQAVEKIKISNPFKVPCEVTLSTKPRGKAAVTEFPFDVEPKKLSIPTHEHRYVALSFCPTAMQTYTGVFEAVVDGAGTKQKPLVFELRGDGTLPHISIEKPSAKTPQGYILFQFPKILIGHTHRIPLVIRNDSHVAATIRVDAPMNTPFTFTNRNLPFIVDSRSSQRHEFEFCPSSERKYEFEAKLRVLNNQFEDMTLLLKGEGFMEDVTFDELPENTENELRFGDTPVGKPKSLSFVLSNNCADIIRFEWADHADFSVTPVVGHLAVGSKKSVKVTYLANQPQDIKGVSLLCNISKIQYKQIPPNTQWESNARATKKGADELVLDDDVASHGATSTNLSPRRYADVDREPAYSVVPKSDKSLELKCFAVSDHARFECETKHINFKNTLMFQTRSFAFNVKNTSNARIDYRWKIMKASEVDVSDTFVVTPESGSIAINESLNFNVRFSPIDDGEIRRNLICEMPNLTPGGNPLNILLSGRSTRPICHFELESSDYLAGGRRNPELRGPHGVLGPLDPDTRVIEIQSCGVKVKNTRRFYILNPTNISYEFQWESENVESETPQVAFRCLTKQGLVLSGKKFEMVFEYTPDSLEITESFWRFQIKDHKVDIPFLLVGSASEPNVAFDRSHVNFNALLLSRSTSETVNLYNNEVIPFSFAFDRSSFQVDQKDPELEIEPFSGVIPPHSSIPIQIRFKPNVEKNYNFNLFCMVRKKPAKLSLNVKGEGYAIHDTIEVESVNGQFSSIVAGPGGNLVDFGQAQLNEKCVKQLVIINTGRTNFDFSWTKTKNPVVTIHPERGTVPRGEKFICQLIYHPQQESILSNCKAVLKIITGNSYIINMVGRAQKPQLHFSFEKHDFGPCFLYRQGTPPLQTTLQITNNDTRDISFETLFESKSYLEVKAAPTVLAPGTSTNIPITFLPRDLIEYKETVVFEVNGLYTVNVTIQGEGVAAKVDLLNPATYAVNFGALRVGNEAKRTVKIINRSKIPAGVNFSVTSIRLAERGIKFTPNGEITLQPKEILPIEITFKPPGRVKAFTEDLQAEIAGVKKPLVTISGACQGMEIKLESDTLPFGAVVKNSKTIRRLQLQNTGDVGTRFKWDTASFSPDFSITPAEGYIQPSSDITLDIAFHPVEINQDIRYPGLKCTLEGGDPLSLTLTGMCVNQTAEAEPITFRIPVRQKQTKTIPITNKTTGHWAIRPVISHEAWSGPEVIEVPEGKTVSYEIAYFPLSMTGETNKHDGTVFFPLPDGTALLYNLVGYALSPQSAGTISRDLKAKEHFTEVLTVTNWLKSPQRFSVEIEMTKTDPATSLKCVEYIDVPGLSKREHKINFYAYKDGPFSARVTFINHETKEFQFYELSYKVMPSGVLSTYDLATPVRQALSHSLRIENPLESSVNLAVTCNSAEISIPPSVSVPPRSEATCTIEFLPLLVRDSSARLTLTCLELGVFTYDLNLKATSAAPGSMSFRVSLGLSQVQTFRFVSYVKAKTDYTCKIDNGDFEVEKTVSAPAATTSAGSEVSVDITYEPSRLGDTRGMLVVSSAQGGEYRCALFGVCQTPKPQGPIVVKAGTTNLPFRNVFSQPVEFTFQVDNPCFAVKHSEVIPGKKGTQIVITFKKPETKPTDPKQPPGSSQGASGTAAAVGSSATLTGKLIVSCNLCQPWIYYLKGV